MKRTGRNILIMLLVLAVLGGAAFLLLQMPADVSGQEESSAVDSSSAPESAAITEIEADSVESVKVNNAKDTYTILAIPSNDGTSTDFTVEGLGGYNLNNTLVTTNVRTILALSASKDLGSQEDLEAFGLKGDAAATVTILQKDGTSQELIFGSAAAESVGKYVLKDDKVYIVSGVPDNFYENQYAFLNKEIYTVPDRTEEVENEDGTTSVNTATDIMYSLTLGGTRYPEAIQIDYSSKASSGYLITSPIMAESGNTPFGEMVTALKSLTADEIVQAGVTDEVLEKYGLNEPEVELSFNMNDSDHQLSLSAKNEEGNRYLLADSNDMVYQVSNEAVKTWAEADLLNLRMSYIWIPNIKNVQKLTITKDGDEVWEFTISRTKNEEKSTEKNTEYDLSITDVQGQEVDYSEAYQPFYQKLIALAVFSQEKAEYSGTPMLRVEYEYFDGGGDVVELYPIQGENRYAATLDGVYNGQVRGTEVSAMLEIMP